MQMTRFHCVERAIEHWLRRSGLVLIVGLAATVGAIWCTSERLTFKTSRHDLLSPASEFHHRWLAYADEFGTDADAVVVVEGPTAEQVTAVTKELGRALRDEPAHFGDVFEQFESERLVAKGLYYLPDPLLEQLEQFVVRAISLLSDPHLSLAGLMQLSRQAVTPESLSSAAPSRNSSSVPASASPLTRSSAARLNEPATMSGRPEPGPWVDLLRNRFPRNLSADSGRMGIVLTRLIQEPSTFVPNDEPFVALEQIAQRARAAHPEVRIGLTGVPLLERDEMKISQQDMTWATVLSVVGVTLMVWAGFGGLKYPLLGALTLLAGIAWTCGYLTLVIGHLNILSMSFGVILVGLGIDFSVHFVARYLQSAEQTRRTDAALVATLCQSAPPILAGAVTTAAAFLAIALTEFRGVAELGMIASGGIMLCAAATLLLLPCAIRLVDSPVTPTALASLPPMERAMIPCWNRPGWTTIGFASLAALLAGGLGRLEYDHNLLNLQAPELPSVQWERRLLERSDRNAIFAVSMAESIDEVRRRADIFRQLDSVQHVEELASVFPPASPEKQERVRRIHRQLLVLADTPPVLQAVSVPPSPADVQRTVVAHQLWRSLHDLKAISDPEPPALDDVPRSIRHRLVGRTGKHLIRIYARGDIWQPGPLERFVDELEQVDPQVTGDPVQTYYASRQMQSSYLRAASLASLAVVGILMVTLRKPTDVLLAALPMVLGLVQLFGLLGWLEIPLNPANIIVLPLLIGIGIDDGIHVVHDRRHNQGARWPTRAMTIGIILTSLTSTLGFGSLLLARHEGLRSLGRVATLGITCCLLTSLVLLPCLLDLFERASRRASRRSRFVVT